MLHTFTIKFKLKRGVYVSEQAIQSKQMKQEKQNALFNKIMLIPIVILLAIVPLVVRLQVVVNTSEVANTMNTDVITDFFSGYKSSMIILVSIAMLGMTFLLFQKEMIKKDKYMITYVISALVFLGVSLIATLTSEYSSTAWTGMPDRAEGMIMTGCYIVILLYTIYAFRKYENYSYIIIALAVLIGISTFLGVFQYFGHDLITGNNFIKSLIIPKEIAEQLKDSSGNVNISGVYESGKVYGTMFHYNYMGSFGAMMVPLFATLTLSIRGKKKKIFLAVCTLASMFLLFGSTSRAGLIGLVVAVIMGTLVFGKRILKRWKLLIPIVVAFLVILVGFNTITNGKIFERIPMLINDMVGLLGSSEEEFNYRDHIPVREVIEENGTLKLVLQDDILTIQYANQEVVLSDAQGNKVEYTKIDRKHITEDIRFKSITFELGNVAEDKYAMKLMFNGITMFIVNLDEVEGVYPIHPYTFERMEIVEAPYIGFEGKEKLGSARGYIWSRSLPLLKDTWLIGNGPDTYALVFPQNDLLAKWWAYDTPNMIVDKPHNLYLQIAINNGGMALLAFLVLVGVYIIHSLKLYAFKSYYSSNDIIGTATMLAVVGYLGAGFFNDSVVSVAPIFWILLGTGIAINFMLQQEKIDVAKRVKHATVDLKTRKHLA